MALPQFETMTETEYLTFELESDIRHEFINGHVYAMSGASDNHNAVSTSIYFLLYGQLRKRPCRVYVESMRVRGKEIGLYTYPDIAVTCEKPDFADDAFDTLLNPQVIMEILSPSTERYDRGEKFQHYRQITSMREYALVSANTPCIEHYLRNDDDKWTFTDVIGLNAVLKLPTIGCTLALSEVYEQVTFTPNESSL